MADLSGGGIGVLRRAKKRIVSRRLLECTITRVCEPLSLHHARLDTKDAGFENVLEIVKTHCSGNSRSTPAARKDWSAV